MSREVIEQLVYTVKDRCRVCYTCVRECPATAIKIINGQADIIQERCIGCGNCVKVCSQGAKTFHNSTVVAFTVLENNEKVIACVAPSFPAEFDEFTDYKNFVGAVKQLGFYKVTEVSFGADLVADKYAELVNQKDGKKYISSDCPSVVSYVEHYYPHLVDNLVPLLSPMDTMALAVQQEYGNDSKIIFIGPCIAKKTESNKVDVSITFRELREMFEIKNIDTNAKAIDFDPPYSAKGAIFPISRGLLNTMGKNDDFGISKIQVTDGSNNFRDALAEFSAGNLKVDYLELLCCQGCISGPGMASKASRFKKRSLINDYVTIKFQNTDFELWEKEKHRFSSFDISRTFEKYNNQEFKNIDAEIDMILESMGKTKDIDMLDCGACGYHTCREHAIAILNGYAEEEMCLPNTIEKLHGFIGELNTTNQNLLNAKDALKQSEKLAHMGQLSAGIAHELNNPLGVITMYSNILIEESDKNDSIREDLQLIVEQAERCKRIVGGLLNFARKNQVILEPTDIQKLCKRSLQSVVMPDNIKCTVIAHLKDPMVYLDKEQMLQVFTNIEKNSFEAMPIGGNLQVVINDDNNTEEVEIFIKDSGTGISDENLKKIFTPFFTTKGVSKGTGLGLPLIYGIIKMHKGRISVISNDDFTKGSTGTEFKIILPRNPDNIKLKV